MKIGDDKLPVCGNVHPHGAVYRRQRRNDEHPRGPLLCPWCDWGTLRVAEPGRPDPWIDPEEWRSMIRSEKGCTQGPSK